MAPASRPAPATTRSSTAGPRRPSSPPPAPDYREEPDSGCQGDVQHNDQVWYYSAAAGLVYLPPAADLAPAPTHAIVLESTDGGFECGTPDNAEIMTESSVFFYGPGSAPDSLLRNVGPDCRVLF